MSCLSSATEVSADVNSNFKGRDLANGMNLPADEIVTDNMVLAWNEPFALRHIIYMTLMRLVGWTSRHTSSLNRSTFMPILTSIEMANSSIRRMCVLDRPKPRLWKVHTGKWQRNGQTVGNLTRTIVSHRSTEAFLWLSNRSSGSKRNWQSLQKAFLKDLDRPIYSLVALLSSRERVDYPHIHSRIWETMARHPIRRVCRMI